MATSPNVFEHKKLSCSLWNKHKKFGTYLKIHSQFKIIYFSQMYHKICTRFYHTCWWCLGDMKVFDVIQSWIWGAYPTSRYWYLLIPTPVQGLACVGGLGGWVFFLSIGFAFSLLAWLPSVLACTCTLVEPKLNMAQFGALAKCKLRFIDSHLKDIFLLRLSVNVSN